MTLELRFESIRECWDEMAEHFHAHWEEAGADKPHMYQDPDMTQYKSLEMLGRLQITTARVGGVLVGYHTAILGNALHYQTILCAKGDLYYLAPGHRNGWGLLRLFQKAEEGLVAKGVKLVLNITKLHADHDKLLTHMGFRPIERTYAKWIGQ